MDRRALHDLGRSRRRREAKEDHGSREVERNLRTARGSRRKTTRKTPDARRAPRIHHPSIPDRSTDRQLPKLGSPSSIPTMSNSWDEHDQSDEEVARTQGDSPRRDRRKSVEATTPTLIDEADLIDDDDGVEQEMVSLEQERLRRNNRTYFSKDESHLRRTPGAQMYTSNFDSESMRRTPGATQMHRSTVSVPSVLQHEPSSRDGSGLGFGLTLSTPVAASRRPNSLTVSTAWEASPSAPTSRNQKEGSPSIQISRPPLPPGSAGRGQRGAGAFIAPLNLSKGVSRLETGSGHGACSPNTLRLREDLGNLLLEDDGEVVQTPTRKKSQFVFGKDETQNSPFEEASPSAQEGAESWTAPYEISMESPSRVSRNSNSRGRRGKTDGSRRSRTYDRSSSGTRQFDGHGVAKTGGFLQHTQQPKAVRGFQPHQLSSGLHFPQSGFASSGKMLPSVSYTGTTSADADEVAPRLLNFGGAFAPPSKNQGGGGFHRQTPSSSASEGNGPRFLQMPSSENQPSFQPNSANFGAPTFHNPLQQPLQPQFGSPQPKFQGHFGSQNPMFGASHAPVSQSPTFNFAPQNVGYPMLGTGMHPMPQDFMPNMQVMHHQRPQMPPLVPPQVWPQQMEMQYDNMQPQLDHRNWHGDHGGWHMGEYPYGIPNSSDTQGLSQGLSINAVPTWTPEPEFLSVDHQASGMGGPHQPGLMGAQPSFSSKTSKRSQRKGPKKDNKGRSRLDRIQRPDAAVESLSGNKSSLVRKNKKKGQKDKGNQDSGSLVSKASMENPSDAKRAELSETPAMRAAFKVFYRKFRAEERSSFSDAESFAMLSLSDGSIPESIHWKIYLELADLAKRANKFREARNLYKRVCHLQPYASQGWLEFSKLEEECGNMSVCADILHAGLEYCQFSENLLTRAIKHEEKMGNLGRARELLSRLKHVGIEKVWRTVLEGALLEARAGNDLMARKVLKYLMHHVPWYGPLYLEAYKLEKDVGRFQEALKVVERGLAAIPRYGPLWFGAFRLCEELDHATMQYRLPQSLTMIDRATASISKELIWKVHLEAAQMLERSAVEFLDESTSPTAEEMMNLARKRFAMTILTCPPNLRWKVWLASGRMEVAAGNAERARQLFLRAHKVVPDKGRAAALLECARLEEFVGDTELARAILCKSRNVSGSDWKVWLESVILETRHGKRIRAIELASHALKLHSGTGRLWASLVHLRHFEEGEEAQFDTLKKALNAVPKSGEVWCEGARIHLNPFACTFDIPSARRHLSFATMFTPQYGDGFLETLRLEIIDQWLVPIAKLIWESTRSRLVFSDESEFSETLTKYVREVAHEISLVCKEDASESEKDSIMDKGIIRLIRESLKPAYRDKVVNVSSLRQLCANADPNYGTLWFHCRQCPPRTARQAFARAIDLMLVELRSYSFFYLSALVRRFAILALFDKEVERESTFEGANEKKGIPENTARWEEPVRKAFLSAPSLEKILDRSTSDKTKPGMDLLESTMTGANFITGLVSLSVQVPLKEMSTSDKQKALFGTDTLFS